jgi:hypothetical protein
VVKPFRGDVTAAGAVALAALAAVVEVRFGGRIWLAAPVAVLLLVLASEAGGRRSAYHAALELSAFVALGLALHEAGLQPGVVAAGLAATGGWFAVRRGSPPLALLGLVALGAASLLLLGRTPWPLFVLVLGCVLGAIAQRDRRPDHAEALAEAGGLAVAAILVLTDGGVGWELLGAAAGFGLVALGGVERRRGMVLVGLVVLAAWVQDAGAGWVLALAAGAAAFLVTGLRPSRPAPPEPARADAEPVPLPFRR